MEKTEKKELTGYVSRNVLSMLGLSLYILADTYFIANGVGPYGLTALNLALPVFNLINGLGLLMGMGGATLFSLNKSSAPEMGKKYFSQLGIISIILGLLFTCCGFFFVEPLARLLGGGVETLPYLMTYLRVILIAAPFFLVNNFVLSFVRNDNNPHLTMVAMIASSLFNIVFDYILVFPLGLGMFGAALATAASPILSLLILTMHRRKPNRLLGLEWARPVWKTVKESVKLGIPSFLTEMSNGVSILVFNIVLLSLAGDIAVAAFGVLANIFLIGLSMFTGTAQGIQPIVSREFGKKNFTAVAAALKFGSLVSVGIGVALYVLMVLFKLPVIQFFNSTNNQELIRFASQGIPIYLFSFLFSGMNIVFSIFFASIAKPNYSFVLVLLRGYLLIIPAVFIMGNAFGVLGVWSSLPVVELAAFFVSLFLLVKTKKQLQQEKEFR
ncbi:MATE family efflux transporter [Enterococcus larvae]|uniref:MATE family efflux transporter n=1 Tax=Enterococcus larvae TaxID=2794352 RepID=UPI003F3752B4